MTKLPKVRRGTPSSKNGTAIPQISPQMISTGFPFKDISYFLKMETNTDLPNAIRESIKSLSESKSELLEKYAVTGCVCACVCAYGC